eukprot:6182202-Pleurochrysis_carterae.AAC.4
MPARMRPRKHRIRARARTHMQNRANVHTGAHVQIACTHAHTYAHARIQARAHEPTRAHPRVNRFIRARRSRARLQAVANPLPEGSSPPAVNRLPAYVLAAAVVALAAAGPSIGLNAHDPFLLGLGNLPPEALQGVTLLPEPVRQTTPCLELPLA